MSISREQLASIKEIPTAEPEHALPQPHRAEIPKYFRVSPKFWDDPKVLAWSDDTKLLALHVLTSKHRTFEGVFVCPQEYLIADLSWNRRKFAKSFTVLHDNEFLRFDPKTNVLLIRNALRYQIPENQNQTKAILRRLSDLPSSHLIREFLELAKVHCYRPGAGSYGQAFYQLLQKHIFIRFVELFE